jgi:hypothetical protein
MDTTTSSTVNSGFVGIKFCQEWFVYSIEFLDFIFAFKYPSNNMLYPKEDKENRILLYAVNELILFLLIHNIPIYF